MQCADDALLVFFFFNLFFIVILLVFFLKILFIYMRERGREGEREGEKPRYSREISVGGLPIRSQPDQTAKQACRLTGKEPTTVYFREDNQPTEPHQPGLNLATRE